MIAAIYARKSTEQSGVPDAEKSVARQVEHARAFAALNGWTVDDDYVFKDDGSGQAKEQLWESRYDGHDSYLPGPGGNWIITDTYVIGGFQYLFLYIFIKPIIKYILFIKIHFIKNDKNGFIKCFDLL